MRRLSAMPVFFVEFQHDLLLTWVFLPIQEWNILSSFSIWVRPWAHCVCVCECVCVWERERETGEQRGHGDVWMQWRVRWSGGNREEPALSHTDSGSACHTSECLTHKSDAFTFRSGCSTSSFITEALSKWEVTVFLKGVGRLLQPSPPLQGASSVRGTSGNEKRLLYGGYKGVSGLTTSVPVRLLPFPSAVTALWEEVSFPSPLSRG